MFFHPDENTTDNYGTAQEAVAPARTHQDSPLVAMTAQTTRTAELEQRTHGTILAVKQNPIDPKPVNIGTVQGRNLVPLLPHPPRGLRPTSSPALNSMQRGKDGAIDPCGMPACHLYSLKVLEIARVSLVLALALAMAMPRDSHAVRHDARASIGRAPRLSGRVGRGD